MLNIYIIAYLNDILIFSKTFEQYYKDIEKVLNYLTKVNLLLKPEKCTFYKKEVDFLNYVIIVKGIKADPEKIRAIIDWFILTNVKELQSFLGTINFNRRFI